MAFDQSSITNEQYIKILGCSPFAAEQLRTGFKIVNPTAILELERALGETVEASSPKETKGDDDAQTPVRGSSSAKASGSKLRADTTDED